MGSSKSKPKPQKEPDKFFEREKWREQLREERRKKKAHPGNRRLGTKEPALTPAAPAPAPGPRAPPPPALTRSYDDEALEHMRYQLKNDSEAFLLNNILLSVQFFEHFEREMHHAKSNPLSEREHYIDEAMVRHHKHVFFADRLQECVQEHVCYRRRPDLLQPLVAPRLYVIYDNLEASEPGDTSDYSAVLDAPFYKLLIEDCREPGFVKLKKLEVLESTLMKEEEKRDSFVNDDDDDSLYSDSEKESNGSDDPPSEGKGDELLQRLKNKINESMNSKQMTTPNVKINKNIVSQTGRRRSGPIRQQNLPGNITNIKRFNISTPPLLEEVDSENINTFSDKSSKKDVHESKTRKSILKITRRLSGSTQELKSANSKNHHDNGTADSETSGYRSASSSRIESSETESDYGYATITESTTPKKVVLSRQSNCALSSGVVPDECWTTVQVRCLDNWSDDEDDGLDDTTSKSSISKNLYESQHYLTSTSFMANFVDNFMIKLGSGLGLTPDSVSNALTQGASVYCDAFRNGAKITYEVFPALIAAWPNAANRWIIRERRVVTNPRTNFSYQWPTKYLVNKAIGFGCLLVPIGFRPKRGSNPDQKMQWRITFPAAERFLESCLAHAQIRCYLFTLTLYKAFMENETCKIGIDASHIKNHLFWQCEDNNAKWPEDRLGESLKTFLESLYVNFAQDRFPNYFIDNCNDFKSIPKPLLRDLQRRLADILEAPVMHVLYALEKLKYTKKDFYPTFNCLKLYEILTCRNPLRILNPNLTVASSSRKMSMDSDDEENSRATDKATDKHYLWSKEKHRQMQERRNIYNRKQKAEGRQEKREIQINRNFLLPKRMEAERRRLVFEFFIPHFIAMARSSEKFEDIRQALIYLEQAQRLCMLLKEEPAGDITANGYLDIIRDKLADCERKLANQVGYKLTPRRESHFERSAHLKDIRKQRPRFENMLSQDSPTDSPGIPAFTFVEIEPTPRTNPVNLKDFHEREESKL